MKLYYRITVPPTINILPYPPSFQEYISPPLGDLTLYCIDYLCIPCITLPYFTTYYIIQFYIILH